MTKQTYRLGALLPRAAGRSADGVAVTALHEYTIDVRDEIPWEWLSITVVAASHIEACDIALDWIMQSHETRACLDGAICEGCASITARSSLASDIRDQGSVQRALTPMVGDVWRRVDRQGYVIPFDDEPNERDEASRAAWRKRVYAEIAGHNEPTERDEASRLDAALDALAEQPDGEPDDGWDRR